MCFGKLQKFLSFISLAALVSMFAVGCGSKTATNPSEANMDAQKQEVFKFKFAGTLPNSHFCSKGMEKLKEAVEQKSNGRMEIEVYPNSELLTDKAMVTEFPKGSVELILSNIDTWSETVPSVGILNSPLYFKNKEHLYASLDGPPGQTIYKEFEKNKIKVLAAWSYGSLGLYTKTPVKKAQDLKGLKIRPVGNYNSILFKTLGAEPVSMSSSKMAEALSKGDIDGVGTGISSVIDRKLYESVKYGLEDELGCLTFLVAVHKDAWDKLPADLQKVLQDTALDIQAWTRQQVDTNDPKSVEQAKSLGMTFYKLPAEELQGWRDKVVPAIEESYKNAAGADKAKTILDAIKALEK